MNSKTSKTTTTTIFLNGTRDTSSVKNDSKKTQTPTTDSEWLSFDFDFKRSWSSTPVYVAEQSPSQMFFSNIPPSGTQQVFTSYCDPTMFFSNGRSGKVSTPV